jgi:hypothetical protein
LKRTVGSKKWRRETKMKKKKDESSKNIEEGD